MKRKREIDDEVAEYGGGGGGDGVQWFRCEMIGKGSFGSVYKAKLKKPRSKFGCFPQFMAVKSAEVSLSGSIQKEREALHNIGPCPYIIGCFGDEITNGYNNNNEMVYNLLLEFGSGGTLADSIKNSPKSGLPEQDVRYYSRSILRGLNHIHTHDYVHCDIKPDNILLVSDGNKTRAKIGDFGLAKRAAKSSCKKRKLDPYWRGTPTYISPEAVIDSVQEAPSDIWAFGCVVLEMLTGKPAWGSLDDLDAEELLNRIGEGGELPKIPDWVSKEGREFLKGCFSRNPMFRLTAEMLLNHSFLEGLVDDDDDDEDIEVEDEEEEDILTEELGFLYETDEYGLFSSSDYVDDQEFYAFDTDGILSDEEFFEPTTSSGKSSALGDIVNTRKESSMNTLQQNPIVFTISAGV